MLVLAVACTEGEGPYLEFHGADFACNYRLAEAACVVRSPPLRGVKAERDYRVEVRLIDSADGRVLATYARAFRSDVGQAVLPGRAPVAGPGHQAAPR